MSDPTKNQRIIDWLNTADDPNVSDDEYEQKRQELLEEEESTEEETDE